LLLGAAAACAAEKSGEEYLLLDRLYVRVQGPLARLGQGNRYTLTVYHKYPTPLHHFRIACSHPDIEVRTTPAEVPALNPTEMVDIEVHVAPRPGARLSGDRLKVPLTFLADELASQPTWPLTLPLTPEAEEELRDADVIPIGSVEVRVRPWAGWETWAYTAGSAALLAVLAWRWVRGRRRRAARPSRHGAE
jgi:hypothetical protein